MFALQSSRTARHLRTVAICALFASTLGAQQAIAAVAQIAPEAAVQKVVNGKIAVQVDNGWVIYQGIQGSTTLNFFDTGLNGGLKLRPTSNGNGLFFNAGGVVFAPCTPGANDCQYNSANGVPGIGIGFGQATFGGPGGAAGGWVNDTSLIAHFTNTSQLPGSIAAAAVNLPNAYAVGWDASTGNNHAVVLKLNTVGNGKNYAPVSQTDLGTLGGPTSQALAISKNAAYVAGTADDASGKGHAVYALPTATSWTDISSGLPNGVLKSKAVAVSSTGYVAGTATVKRLVGGSLKTVDIGFVYNIGTSTMTTFEAPGFNVEPLKVLDNGHVVGNLVQVAAGSIKSNHPFMYDGISVNDYGLMGTSFGCRVNRPNNLGELAGSCIPNAATPYGVGGTAFYLNTNAATPTFVDVNAAVHANEDANYSFLRPYHIGSVSSMDDQDEITTLGVKFVAGNPNLAAFLMTKASYNP